MSETSAPPRRRRTLRNILIGLVVAVLALHVGGGWYFSDQIYAGTLQVPELAGYAEPNPNLPDPGSEYGLEFDDVTYTSPAGAFPTWVVPGEADDAWVILVHGRGGVRHDWLPQVQTLHELGYTVMVLSYRNDPNSPPDPSGEYRFGLTEWEDLSAAVDLAVAEGAEQIVLYGGSMGGAIIASYLRHGAADQVEALILDSPLLNLSATVDLGATQLGFPVPATLLWSGKQIFAWRTGLSWAELDYINPSDYLDVPTLIIHGVPDPVVPISTSRELVAAHPDLVTLVETDAGHVRSWAEDPEGFDATLAEFLLGLP